MALLFFLPTYGTLLAAVSFDRTGTMKIGKCLRNHGLILAIGVLNVVPAR